MVAEVRRLKFLEGVQVSSPISFAASTRALTPYADSMEYELNEGLPQAGSIFFNTTLSAIEVYNGSSWENIDYKRSGVVSLTSGESSKTISFSTPYSSSNYVAQVCIECSDSDPMFLQFIIKNKTVNGFTVVFNAPVDSNNYKINYKIGN